MEQPPAQGERGENEAGADQGRSEAPPPYPPASSPPAHEPTYPPAGYPQPYPPPPYPQYPAQKVGTNGFAIASLVLGIIWVYWIGSILALIFGHVAKSQIDRANGAQGGRGMAIAGIVLGWIGVGVLLLVIVLVAIGLSTAPY